MFYIRVTFWFLALYLAGCDDYEEVHVSQREVVKLDSAFAIGQFANAKWAKSPGEFCKHEFPRISNEGEPLYFVQEECNTARQCIVTVKEEGPIDDEVLGEKHIIGFSRKDSIWKVVSYRFFVKRRY